ncbi:MAG: TRASH domain-containing protein [Thermoplasmatales archaeon]|nr:TRASH domain-containing protein [Candidatus Thermoplasmatota archaeon]MCL6002797.1 TRASH domain-containing protein [Candidatus Thermoplasmatota archaeon]MDA8056128.1 TRASH domain-containing protein [Thermoplasmatales archaeon]
MSRLNLSHNESKILRALEEDSRLSVNDVAKITNLNRNTVRTAIKSLVSNKIITRFTVNVSLPESEKLILLEVDDLEQIPEGDRIEVLELANGRFVVVSNINVLKKDIRYINLNIIKKKQDFESISTKVKTYCDYCGKEIEDVPLILRYKQHQYFACCENCKRDLAKRIQRAEKGE